MRTYRSSGEDEIVVAESDGYTSQQEGQDHATQDRHEREQVPRSRARPAPGEVADRPDAEDDAGRAAGLGRQADRDRYRQQQRRDDLGRGGWRRAQADPG